jgi:hypothetical protein
VNEVHGPPSPPPPKELTSKWSMWWRGSVDGMNPGEKSSRSTIAQQSNRDQEPLLKTPPPPIQPPPTPGKLIRVSWELSTPGASNHLRGEAPLRTTACIARDPNPY